MEAFIFEDDMVTLFIRPKEQSWDDNWLREVPQDLIDRYKAVEEEYKSVQEALRRVWEGK